MPGDIANLLGLLSEMGESKDELGQGTVVALQLIAGMRRPHDHECDPGSRLGRVEPVHVAGSGMAGCMVAYSQARFDVCRDVVAVAQQQRFQHLPRSRFLLYARTEQPRSHRGHELSQVTSPIAGRAARSITGPI
jgi:hypothetical protein